MNRKTILVVDDNEVIVKTLTLKLKASDYNVVTAADGSEAVAAVRSEKPDLILLDINFPDPTTSVPWDGFRIIAWLRRVNEAHMAPIIIISGEETAKYKDRALAEGAVAFFQKPINNEELIATIHEVLDDCVPEPTSTGRSVA